jgi:hypothetical protein
MPRRGPTSRQGGLLTPISPAGPEPVSLAQPWGKGKGEPWSAANWNWALRTGPGLNRRAEAGAVRVAPTIGLSGCGESSMRPAIGRPLPHHGTHRPANRRAQPSGRGRQRSRSGTASLEVRPRPPHDLGISQRRDWLPSFSTMTQPCSISVHACAASRAVRTRPDPREVVPVAITILDCEFQ